MCLSSQDKFDCTSTSPICPSDHLTYLPVLPSFPGSADSSIIPFFLSVCLSVQLSVLPWLCWQLLGLMPSQCSAPSWPLERRLHSLSRWTGNHSFTHFFSQIFLPVKSLFYPFPHLLQLSICLFLSSVSISTLLHSWPSCCWGADRERDWERQIGNIQSLEGLCSESLPAKPKASFLSSPCHPHAVLAPRLHACLQWCALGNGEMETPQTNISRLLKHKWGTQE